MSDQVPSGLLQADLEDGSTLEWEVWGFEFATEKQAKQRFDSLNRTLGTDTDVSFWRIGGASEKTGATLESRFLVMMGEPQRCRAVLRYFAQASPWQVPERAAYQLADRRMQHLREHPQGGSITRRFSDMGGLRLRSADPSAGD